MARFARPGFKRDFGCGRISAGAPIVNTAFDVTILLKEKREYL